LGKHQKAGLVQGWPGIAHERTRTGRIRFEGIGRQITTGLNREVEASVSDSRSIVTVQQNTISSIWRMETHAQSPELVVSGESGTSGPVWTPDGRIVFEEELQGQRSIWRVDLDGKNRKQLLLEGNSYDHSVSSNGNKIAFIGDKSDALAVWTRIWTAAI